MSVTWDPAHADPGYTLSPDNLTATLTSGTGDRTVRATLASTGSFDVTFSGSFSNAGVGFGPSTQPLGDWVGDSAAVGYQQDGRIYFGGTLVQATGVSYTDADKITASFDGTHVQYYKNGAAVGTPVDVSPAPPLYPMVSSHTDGIAFTGIFSAWGPSSGTTYNDTLSESLTSAAALANALTTAPVLAEALTGAFSLASSATFRNTLAESVAANDNASGVGTFPNTLSESATAAAAYSQGSSTYNDSVSEGLTAGDAAANAQTMPNALGEAVASSDGIAGGVTMSSTRAESLTAADGAAMLLTISQSVSEAIVANDNAGSVANFVGNVNESAALLDQYTGTGGAGPRQYPLAGISQTYPLEGVPQQYPLAS